jgi:hypothetical protein
MARQKDFMNVDFVFEFQRNIQSKRIFSAFICVLFLFFGAYGQSGTDLPRGAQIIETQAINAQRNLILWMPNPKKNPRDGMGEIYTCPEYTRGNYYSGKTRVSLIDAQTKKIINTIEVANPNSGTDEDSFDIPYLIERHYYEVPTISSDKQGKPKILALRDFNGDGKKYEFAFYDALACMGLSTALFGYSEKQDKVIQYPVELKSSGKTEKMFWVDYFFSKKSLRKGFWKYEIDYRGRGGSLDKYEIYYDAKTESFRGTLVSLEGENN